MQEGRLFTVKKKPRIILDKRFNDFTALRAGDKKQAIIEGQIIEERKEMSQDGTEYLIKTIKIDKAKIINDKIIRADL